MANLTITQLPAAGTITGTESVPIVQNGQTVRTTTAAIAASPSQNQTFLTKVQEPTLPNSRYLSTGSGLGLTDGGAQSYLRLEFNGAAASLETVSPGVLVKTGATTIANRTLTASGAGLSITNGDGISGNPTFALSGLALALANSSGTGMLAVVNGTTIAGRQIYGTASQITVANGNGSGDPTIAIADNATFPGTGAVTLPNGTTGQQPVGANGQMRFNTSTNTFDGYASGSWRQFALAGGVTSFSAGTTGFTPSSTTSGAITLAGTLIVANGGTGATTLTGYVTGNGTGAMTASASIPTTDLSGTITNAQLANSSLTIGTTAISLGSSSLTLGGLTSVAVTQDPTTALQLATKQYVDAVAQGLDPKASCVAATTANITLSGAQTIDGVALIAGDRCLVKDQTLSQNNGIYLVAAAAWTRATDMDSWAEVPGAYTFIEQGTLYADTGWVCTSNAGGTLGTTAITWVQFAGVGSYTAGTGLTLTGTQFSLTSPVTAILGGTGQTVYAVGDLLYANTTTTLAKLADVATGNALISGGVTTAPSWGKIGLTTHVDGTLALGNGGLGITSGTSGGIPYFSATSTIASSALLAASALMIGGGAGVAPATTTTGTGVVTALGVDTGTAGAFVVNGGVLGTPSSGTVTNLTGTASININGTVGATTPTTGAFTTVTATTGIFGGTF